jgi:voltage-gated potassium channel
LILLTLLLVVGVVGLRLVEGAPWIDCFYMAVITVSTVGYEDPVSLTPQGKLFVSLYLMGTLWVFTYSLFQMGQLVVGAELQQVRERRHMKAMIDQLKDHYIVCGQGRMGLEICRYLAERNKPFVVVEIEEAQLERGAVSAGWLHIHGDATDDQTLRQAGIERARSVSTVLSSDAANLYVVLSARMMSPTLQIIARASEEKAIEKLVRAGADRVVSPFSTGAIKIARFMLNPSIEDLLEIADGGGGPELELAEFEVSPESPYVGQSLRQVNFRARGVTVIAIRRPSGERLMLPSDYVVLQPGDCLIAFGNAEAINAILGVDRRR